MRIIGMCALTAALIASGVLFSSCKRTTVKVGPATETVVVKKGGPPPHAPAHGYRHKHGKVVLVYEASLGVYVVEGHSGYFFHRGDFYRSHKGGWEISANFSGPWTVVAESKVPRGMKQSKPAKGKKNK